jgi:hypothetical protein
MTVGSGPGRGPGLDGAGHSGHNAITVPRTLHWLPVAEAGTLKTRHAFVVGLAVTALTWAVPVVANAAGACRGGDPLENVRDPGRLRVLKRCVTATGVIQFAQREKDDDVHISLAVDREYRYLLNDGNRRKHHGTLVVEIVPADQPGCRKGERVRFGTCTGAAVRTPHRGERVRVTGPWVLDREHGWREIHPAWRIERRS